jgi:cob(I)alamin adenosyltransferase
MIKLAEEVTEAAQDGAITVEQIPEIYDQFKTGVTKASTYEDAGEVSDEAAMGMAPAKSIEQQLSKLRQFVILGGKYESDALDLIRKARNMHIELLRSANGDAEVKKGIKPGSTYTVMVDVARAQLKKNKDALDAAKLAKTPHTLAPLLDDRELHSLMTQEVREPVDKTGEDYLLDTLIKARATAKGSDKRNAITCEELDNAIQWLRAAMGKVAPDMLAAYDADEAAAHQAREDAKRAKQEAEEEKARKAAEPRPSRASGPSKAERQAGLATPVQQGAAQPAA